ncbi:MAG: metallophosphoesterase family protein, partial [Oscillospiraceae bacterium]
MRIIVLGDTHGCYSAIQKVVDANRSADMFIHLGDGERELDDFLSANPNINFYNVKGNCDYASMAEEVLIIGTGEHKILATHGHSFG